jgi:hypothetical protein
MPVGRTVGMMEAVTEAWAARRMALYEQPSQRLPLLSGGVQDPPTTTSTLTEPAAEQWQGEQALPTTTASAAPPTMPPSAGDIAGAASPDPSANFAGGGAFHADTTVVSPPQPVAGILAASVEPLGMSRIETDYANLLSFAMSLEKMARDEIARLSNERPNDPYTIESDKKHLIFSLFLPMDLLN